MFYGLMQALENYGNLALFDTFLYPYFEQETLKNLIKETKTPTGTEKRVKKASNGWEEVGLKLELLLTSAILNYLQMCCIVVDDVLDKVANLRGKPTEKENEENLRIFNAEIASRTAFLFTRLIVYLSMSPPEYPPSRTAQTDFDTIRTVSLDNKFMNNLDTFHTTLEKAYKKCIEIREFFPGTMACRIVCENLSSQTKVGYSYYADDKKYCRRCEVYLYHRGVFCPCCGMALQPNQGTNKHD